MYDELTLLDPRAAADDDEARRLCARFQARPAGIRNSLTADDFYRLLLFAERAAVFAIRETAPAWIADGLTAIAIVDDERIEPNDIDAAIALLHYTANRIGADANALFAAAAGRATSGVARRLKRAASLPLRHEEVAAGFVDRGDARYERNLTPAALAIRTMLQGDRYRVESVAVATALPPIWFAPSAAALLSAVRATASVHARRRDDADQAVLAYVADLDRAGELARLTAGDALLAVAAGTRIAVLVARSFVADAAPAETSATLQRFAEPLRAIVAEATSAPPPQTR